MKKRFIQFNNSQAWSANGKINTSLAPTDGTITRLAAIIGVNVTTGASPGTYNDPWDRIISTLNLNYAGTSLFSYGDMRLAWFGERARGVKGAGALMKRPPAPAASTTLTQYFGYLWHFGRRPRILNPVTQRLEDNPYDLSGGIPAAGQSTLGLTGTFGPANAPGSGWTVNSGTINFYAWMVQPEGGADDALVIPESLPVWSTEAPNPTSTSAQFGTTHGIPSGNFLSAVLQMTTLGANAPRSSAMLASEQLYNARGFTEIGQSTNYPDLELMQAGEADMWPPADDPANPGALLLNGVADPGITYWDLTKQLVSSSDPLLGVDLTNKPDGSLVFQYGVGSVTGGAGLEYLYYRYMLNPDHPATPIKAAASAGSGGGRWR